MLLFCVKTIMKESWNFELSYLKKKKKKKKARKHICNLVTSGMVLWQCFFAPLCVLLVMKTLKDEWCIVIKAIPFLRF